EPIAPPAELPVEDGNDSERVEGERAEIDLRDGDVARWAVPVTVPAPGRRRPVPTTLWWRPHPVRWGPARRRSVVPAEPALPWWRRRAVAHDAEADRYVGRTTHLGVAPHVRAPRNERRVRGLSARCRKPLLIAAP